MSDVWIVMTTFGDEATARNVGRSLVEEGLAACATIVPGALSIYRWEGQLCEEREVVVYLKTTHAGYAALEGALKEQHPYDEPEIIALVAIAGSAGYLDFVKSRVAQP